MKSETPQNLKSPRKKTEEEKTEIEIPKLVPFKGLFS